MLNDSVTRNFLGIQPSLWGMILNYFKKKSS